MFSFHPDHVSFHPDHKGKDPLAYFREVAREIEGRPQLRPLRNIIVVGAIHDEDGLSFNDESHLYSAFSYCSSRKIPVSPNFVLTPFNLLHGSEHDFLDPDSPLKGELLIVSYVYDPKNEDDKTFCDQSKILRTSPHHLENDVWRRAALRSNAQVILAFGGITDVLDHHFLRRPHDDTFVIDRRNDCMARPSVGYNSAVVKRIVADTFGEDGDLLQERASQTIAALNL